MSYDVNKNEISRFKVLLQAIGSQPVGHDSFGDQMTFSQESHIKYTAYQIFVTIAKLQLHEVAMIIILWSGVTT